MFSPATLPVFGVVTGDCRVLSFKSAFCILQPVLSNYRRIRNYLILITLPKKLLLQIISLSTPNQRELLTSEKR
jgi:hypothetical protein